MVSTSQKGPHWCKSHADNDPDWRGNANRGNSHNRMSDNPWTSSGRADRDPNWRRTESQAYSLFPSDGKKLLWDPDMVSAPLPEPKLSQTPDQFKASVLAKLAKKTVVLRFHNTNAGSLIGFFEKLDKKGDINIDFPAIGRPASITIQKSSQGVETLLDKLFDGIFTAQRTGISACYIQEDEAYGVSLGTYHIHSTGYVELQQGSVYSGGSTIQVTTRGVYDARTLKNRLNSNLR